MSLNMLFSRYREPQPPRRMPATLKQDKHYDLASIEDVELYSVVDEKGVTHHFERSVTMSALPLTNTETYHKVGGRGCDIVAKR
jgi:predicted secreted Zn-dependent protease